MGYVTINYIPARQVVVVVEDTNPENQKYDSRERVKIVSTDGKISTDPEQVKTALRELGITALKHGTNLWSLGHYTSKYLIASDAAKRGDIKVTQFALTEALSIAKAYKLPVDRKLFESVARTSLIEAYGQSFVEAVRLANGYERFDDDAEYILTNVSDALSNARNYAKQAGLLFDQRFENEIWLTASRTVLQKAKRLASIGYKKDAEKIMENLRDFKKNNDGDGDEYEYVNVPYDRRKFREVESLIALK